MCTFISFLLVGNSHRDFFVDRGLVVNGACFVESGWRVTVVVFVVSEGRGNELEVKFTSFGSLCLTKINRTDCIANIFPNTRN